MNEMCAFIGKMHEFHLALKKAGFNDELIQQVINSKDNEMAKKMFAVITIPEVVSCFTVNYEDRIEERIKEGSFDYSDPKITSKRFPLVGHEKTREVKTRLVQFQKTMSSEEALTEIRKRNLRPANAHELISFAEKNPETQKDFPIIALGSIWKDMALSLYGSSSKRWLVLNHWNNDWVEFCRFLAVEKE
jgi:hypothetical protein